MWDVAIFPHGATTETFAWRLSIAEISTSRPFSLFPGVARHFALLTGDGVTLTIKGREPVSINPADPAFEFSGDDETASSLHGGPVFALNLMTREGFSGILHLCSTKTGPALNDHVAGQSILIAGSTGASLRVLGKPIDLAAFDALALKTTEIARGISDHTTLWLAKVWPS